MDDKKRSKRSRSGDKKKRSSSGSPSPTYVRPKKQRAGFSNFSDQPPEQLAEKKSTQEILEFYKQLNPNQNLTNHNKAERQLYVGNIPPGLSSQQIVELLNAALKEMGKEAGIFQDQEPIVGAWISGDSHYAFVDFRTPEDTT